ncbi:trimeric intracellular cation channel family protein [Paraburkholderia sp. CNPSo 3157]|uniref:Trimeric intracellular cation channel family protein n=1 Tax=Paraburkholderia franconis TaxID=2654983 RepID=A0A7X1NG15_9BURK|nr:TRIC cation channel family protein [Paraburkholderia franconis]MPW21244.1 trimeric intracellular cation channel family protein [Paraburkholderia franconis]
MKPKMETIVLAADLAGTFIFAIEGAVAAMHSGLDLLGVMVIAFVASLGGGVTRDLLIGASPPNAIRDWRYPALTFVAGLLTFVFHSDAEGFPAFWLMVLDAAGLALFAVAGVEKAILFGIRPFVAALMGAVTGVGGGVIRDVLLARIPSVLVADIYATAAFFGAVVVLIARRLGLSPAMAGVMGGVACFGLRVVAATHGWHLPRAMI